MPQPNCTLLRCFSLGRRAWASTRHCFLLGALLLLLPLALRAQETPLRFAWLSDTHIGSSTGEDDLRASVSDINAQSNLSFVIISGDITEYGSLEQLRLAKDILDGLKLPCHVIPGNHDAKWSESGATDFTRLWPSERFDFEAGGYRFLGMYQGPIMKMGDGFWSPQDVRWLRNTLAGLPDKQQPVIFVTHYPLDDGIANWYEVLDLLKQYNTQVVLCGHGHADHNLNFEGMPGVMGRSNLRARHPAPGYNLVEIRDGLMTVTSRMPGQPMRPPWDTVRLQKHDFAADTNTYPRPDFSVNQQCPGVKPRWVYDTGYTIASTPAVYKNLAIMGDASGTVYALRLDSGKPAWTYHCQNAVYSTPAVSGDTVVFGCADAGIYALKASNGKLLWRKPTSRPVVASPVIGDGVVYIGSSEGKFWALNLASGKPLWQYDRLSGFVETRPLLYQGKVLFGAWDQCLYALDQKSGKLAWKWRGDHRGVLFSPAACWPVAAHDKVFIVAPDRRMTALDSRTGEQLWRTGKYVVRESIGLSADQSRFYVRAMNDWFYALSTTASQPELVWERNAHFGYDINSAMLVEKDGVVFYGTKNGLLFALNAKSGAIRWEHKLGVGVMNTVLPLSASRVLATDFDGKVALLEAK